MKRGGALAFALACLVACQVKPTRVAETEARPFAMVVDKTRRPIELGDTTVILDTRPAFAFGLNHVENSLPFTWEHLADSAAKGDLLKDARLAGLRLSLLGLAPETPVLVVGRVGAPDAGRLAWTLLYLGFRDVQVASIEPLRAYWTQKPSISPKNLAAWTPEPSADLVIGRAEFKSLGADPQRRLQTRTFIIDVRSEAEYLAPTTPNIGALNIPWTKFFDSEGRVNVRLRKLLGDLGVRVDDQIVVVSERGVRSGAATFALIAAGFAHARNYLEGWRAYRTSTPNAG